MDIYICGYIYIIYGYKHIYIYGYIYMDIYIYIHTCGKTKTMYINMYKHV